MQEAASAVEKVSIITVAIDGRTRFTRCETDMQVFKLCLGRHCCDAELKPIGSCFLE